MIPFKEFAKTLDQNEGYIDFVKRMDKLKSLSVEIDKREELLGKMYPASWVMDELLNKCYDLALSYFAEYMKDTSEWISWFIYENEWGTKKMEASINDVEVKVTSYKELYWLMMSTVD